MKEEAKGSCAFCRFVAAAPGGASAYLRYISRPSAVRDGLAGVLLRNLPETKAFLSPFPSEASSVAYTRLQDFLTSYVWILDRSEQQAAKERGRAARTYYRATVSFESELRTSEVLGMVSAWLAECFPTARATGFLHRDTARPHVHLWIGARGVDGAKLHFTLPSFRSLRAAWSRHYEAAYHRDISLLQEPGRGSRAYRDSPKWKTDFREKELRAAGAYDINQSAAHGDKPEVADGTPGRAGKGPDASRGERAAYTGAADAERAVSDAWQLHQAAARLAQEREQAIERQEQDGPKYRTSDILTKGEREPER